MKQSKNVLISYTPPFDNDEQKEILGYSGIMISKHWIITHGTLMNPLMQKNVEINHLFTNLKTGEFLKIPNAMRSKLKFRIMWEKKLKDDDDNNNDKQLNEIEGTVVIAWKCSLLNETFDSLFSSWKFNKIEDKHDGSLLPVFLMISLKSNFLGSSIMLAREALNRFIQQDLAYPVRGSIAEIESTPFGNPVFINSIARGIISNIIGSQKCVIISDTNSVPGSEGAPVYVISR